MNFKSIPEILRFAISKEQASVQFYRNLMSKAVHPPTQALFEVLVQKEQEHIASLQLEMNKFGYTVEMDADKLDSEFQWEENLDNDDQVLQMSFMDGLVLAIQKERAAFRLYAQLLGTVQDDEMSRMLMDLAEEEMRHVLQLEQEYESLRHRQDRG